MDEIKLLKELVQYNTINDKENQAIMDYIEQYLLKLGFKTEYKGKNLIMKIKDENRVGFLGHTDTVNSVKGWDTNPFELKEEGNKLIGLGASDMKGGIAAILIAVSQIDFSKLKKGIKLYFTYDEEIGFQGIKELVKNKEKFPENMIIGESTKNEVITGSKGLLEFKINFKGIRAHSSTPNKGKNAINSAINFINELQKFYSKNIKEEELKQFEIPYTTMNIGKIQGGDFINAVADNCTVWIDFRTVEKNHAEKIKTFFELQSKIYNFEYEILNEINSFMNESFIDKQIRTVNYITEASFIEANRIILGPGPITGHEANEYITKESLLETIEIYKNIIMNHWDGANGAKRE